MILRPGRLLGGGRPPALPGLRVLVSPGVMSDFTLTRAQVSSSATSLLADAATWQEYAADTARFFGTGQRLLTEGQRTNLVVNPRTAFGTGWTLTGIVSVTPITGPDGVALSAARVDEGAATSGHNANSNTFTATLGVNYVQAAMLRAGTCSTAQLAHTASRFTAEAYANFDLANGALGTKGTAVTHHRITPAGGGWYWCEMAAPCTSGGGASAALVVMTESASVTRNPAYTGSNRYLDVFWAQSEAAAFASTPILPPVGAPGASTRGADLASTTLSSLGIGASGACTLLWSGVIPQAAPTGAVQTFLCMDDGSANNRYVVHNPAGGLTVVAFNTNGGVVTSAGTGGSFVAGAACRVGIAIDGAGRMAASVNGGAPVVASSGPVAGLTTLRLGNNSGGAGAMFGQTAWLEMLPYALPDYALPAVVANLRG